MKFIIKESKFKETIIDNIDNNGLLDTLKLTNMSFTKLFSMIGMDFLTNKVMINFIIDFIKDYGVFSVHDIGEDPIPYNKTGDEYREISYFSKQYVYVDVYSGNNNLGNFKVHYESLDDDKLMEVFDLMIRAYDTFETLGNI
jgi:hypothetical protein